ncbi:MAG: LacI family transcriptional regulator [Flavobacteriales bacterium]|nr:LacI family transcriptional regulator [Flavobacteriia bacterium]NCP04977.1 LacI family transcriptional regulator [Flavobacteriales bacterium]PIV93490.1 MAG: LacI family transcriptional regulator [Flavobacteriaceae bacterium CG17_big_fil_post_rev_8_21_14_2_50_33_15]PIY09510.1 MAG: LacI family transcriptional regulator [Flavobacteriaceae bacterium CG_4_10_14_3_um_filter_33_47]PJB16884.1 MAG: LacI family transcriptional regulator [Flavobacteriaceae bacterium CG_4_9_14_3_um_filter_33_16]
MVTLKQLAKELNVSISTVSKALNNSDEIGEETVKRVKELAALYNYKPNKVALSLKQNKTKTIGVIIPNILNHFLAKVLFAIEREATEYGYNIITCISNESLEKEIKSLQLLANGSVDGFILAVSKETQMKNETAHFNKIINQGLPIVMFDRVANDVLCDKVIVDDFDATYNAAKMLIGEKRKHIAFMSTIDDLSLGKLREKGFLKAIDEEPRITGYVLKLAEKDDEQKKIMKFLKDNKMIDGVISADSSSGVIALNTALSYGLKVPKDISVMGFTSLTIANHCIPRLTTIRQHANDIGACVTKLLLNRLQHKSSEELEFSTKIIKTSLVKSDSTL